MYQTTAHLKIKSARVFFNPLPTIVTLVTISRTDVKHKRDVEFKNFVKSFCSGLLWISIDKKRFSFQCFCPWTRQGTKFGSLRKKIHFSKDIFLFTSKQDTCSAHVIWYIFQQYCVLLVSQLFQSSALVR